MTPLPAAARELAAPGLRWARQRYPLATHRALARETDGVIASALWSEIADLGWTQLLLPESAGGLGGSLVQAGAIAHVCGRSLLALPWLEHAVLAASALLRCPPGAARDAALAAAARERFAVALQEPGRRHPLQEPACTAHQAAGGWRLLGEKVAVEAPAGAPWLLVSARSGDGEDLLLRVDTRAAGVHVQDGLGLDGHRIGRVRFDQVHLPAGALLAAGAAARDALAAALDLTALAACAEAAAIAEQALEHTVEHLRTRRQFGQPIGSFQALRHRAADLFVATRYAAAMAWGTIEEVDADPAGNHGAAVAAAKADVLRNARGVLAGATQLHGGMGVVDELPISHGLKRVLALQARYGDRPGQLERLAGALLVSPSAA